MANDLTALLKVNDRPIAEEIQKVLEDAGIYTILESNNPASSAMTMYVGNNVIETITIVVSKDSYLDAAKILEDTPYFDFLADA